MAHKTRDLLWIFVFNTIKYKIWKHRFLFLQVTTAAPSKCFNRENRKSLMLIIKRNSSGNNTDFTSVQNHKSTFNESVSFDWSSDHYVDQDVKTKL